MNTQVILAEKATSGKNTNNVWFVYISGHRDEKLYCTSPYKAMRLAFLLKKRTGLNISENILARLSFEVARLKASTAPQAQEEKAPQPAPQKPAPKKRGRKPKAVKAA